MSDPIVPGFYAVGDAATFPVAHDGQVFEVVHGGLGAVLTRTGLHDTRRDAEAVASRSALGVIDPPPRRRAASSRRARDS